MSNHHNISEHTNYRIKNMNGVKDLVGNIVNLKSGMRTTSYLVSQAGVKNCQYWLRMFSYLASFKSSPADQHCKERWFWEQLNSPRIWSLGAVLGTFHLIIINNIINYTKNFIISAEKTITYKCITCVAYNFPSNNT